MNFADLSLRKLTYVVAVAELGSFVKAAERCHVSQPSLSVQVSKLEARLGCVIFERTTRRLIVTPEGHRVVEQMRKVLSEARILMALSTRSQLPFGGSLRLSAIATLGPYYFPHILHTLRGRYPGLSFVLGEGKTDELVALLLQGELDAVLMAGPVHDASLMEVTLFNEPFVMACPTGHPATREGGGGWSDLPARQRLLLEEGHCLRDQAIAACAGVDPTARHATSLETLKYMVAAGEGCPLLPALAAAPALGLQYVRLPGSGYSRTIVLAWRGSDPRFDQFHELARHLQEFRSSDIEQIRRLTPGPVS